jgi:CRISPR/Cas system-associated endonuclease Cas1
LKDENAIRKKAKEVMLSEEYTEVLLKTLERSPTKKLFMADLIDQALVSKTFERRHLPLFKQFLGSENEEETNHFNLLVSTAL